MARANSLVSYLPPAAAKGYDITKSLPETKVKNIKHEQRRHKECVERNILYVPNWRPEASYV